MDSISVQTVLNDIIELAANHHIQYVTCKRNQQEKGTCEEQGDCIGLTAIVHKQIVEELKLLYGKIAAEDALLGVLAIKETSVSNTTLSLEKHEIATQIAMSAL